MKKFGFTAFTLLAGATLGMGQYVPPTGGGPITVTPASADIGAGSYLYFYAPLCTKIQVNTTSLASFSVAFSVRLQELSFPNLKNVFQEFSVVQCNGLFSITVPQLVTAESAMNLGEIAITNISFPKLTTASPLQISGGLTNLFRVDVPLLTNCTGTLAVDGCAVLPKLDLHSLRESTTGLALNNDPVLTSINLSSYVPENGVFDTYSGDALTADAENLILVRYVDNAAFVSGTIDLSGGSNATPDVTGLAYIATLTLRGVTVFNN